MAELMPTSSPLRLTSAPPELPGLMAASVWMALSTAAPSPGAPLPADTGRFLALTMPVVTVPLRPSGEPMATTVWPTCRSSEEPSLTGDQDCRRFDADDGEVGTGVASDDLGRRTGAVVEASR